MREITLTQGKAALVDDEVFDRLNPWGWYANRCGKPFYAVRNGSRANGARPTLIYMHRVIWELIHGPIPGGFDIDHVDRDGLNNRGDNLRLATPQQQNCNRGKQSNNTSGLVGVSWDKHKGRWHARAQLNGRKKHLGYFHSAIEASLARDKFVLDHHGKFAELNCESLRR